MTKINYKSDFDFLLHLTDCQGGLVGCPEMDWEAHLYTTSRLNAYTAWRRGDEMHNCYNDGGEIHIVMNDHRLSPGTLNVEFHVMLPNDIYPDGVRDLYTPESLDITLTRERGDECTAADADIIAPYIKGDKGDKGERGEQGKQGEKGDRGDDGSSLTYDDLTDEQIKQLQLPATAAADGLRAFEQEASKNESARVTAETSRQAAENERQTAEQNRVNEFSTLAHKDFIEMFNYLANRYVKNYGGYNEATGYFVLGTVRDLTLEQARAIMASPASTMPYISQNTPYRLFYSLPIRATFPLASTRGGGSWNCEYMFLYCSNLEEVVIASPTGINENIPSIKEVFNNCYSLRKAVLPPGFGTRPVIDATRAFGSCRKLEDLTLPVTMDCDIDLKESPLLNLASFQRLTECYNLATAPRTVTIHPDIYARIMDENNTEWHALLDAIADKNFTFATV